MPRPALMPKDAPMRVLGYVRVSTGEQRDSGAGLAAQRETIMREAERRGWVVLRVIEDAGFSAKDLRRPGVQVALEELRAGRADALVCAKLDRLSRSMLDFSTLMAEAQKQSWGLIALDCDVDTTSPAGEAMANILAVFSQFERRLIGQRTREALAIRKELGQKLGRPRSLDEKIVRRIVQERDAGATMSAIADRLNDEGVPTAQGGRKWWPATIRAILASVQGP